MLSERPWKPYAQKSTPAEQILFLKVQNAYDVAARGQSDLGHDVSMIVKAKGPSGPAKIHSDDPKHALGLVQYLRTIGYKAWIEDANGNVIEETVLKNAIK